LSVTRALRQDCTHLFVCGEVTPRDLRICLGEVSAFLGRQQDNGLFLAGHLQEQACKLALHLGGRARTLSTAGSSSLVMVERWTFPRQRGRFWTLNAGGACTASLALATKNSLVTLRQSNPTGKSAKPVQPFAKK
jgi:hypothetical protein